MHCLTYWGIAPEYLVLRNRTPCQTEPDMKPNVPHPMIDRYGAFGFFSITFEWVVWLRNDFTGVVPTHVDTFQPIFGKIRRIIRWPIDVNVSVGSPIICKLNCSWSIRTTNTIKTWTIPDTIRKSRKGVASVATSIRCRLLETYCFFHSNQQFWVLIVLFCVICSVCRGWLEPSSERRYFRLNFVDTYLRCMYLIRQTTCLSYH